MTLFLISLYWFTVGFLVVATLVPFSKIPHGAIRSFAFPREQFFVLALAMFAITLVFLGGQQRILGLIATGSVIVINAIYIAKFTPLWRSQSVNATPEEREDGSHRVTLIASNVKQSNRDYSKLINLIKTEKPDIATALEVDAAWVDALYSELKDDFQHWVKVDQENSYGMVLMSRLPLDETEVRELLVEGVPSIRTRVRMDSGQEWRLYIVHPEPPVPYHDTKGRDGEIALIGMEAKKDPLPSIVTGDLNDVAWSTTTRRFQALSGLLDPRIGRGFYNTFHAGVVLARWPLDHLFHDPEFRLIRLARMPNVGSDHFPILFSFALSNSAEAHFMPEQSSAEEREEVREIVEDERNTDREAIGTDWEKG